MVAIQCAGGGGGGGGGGVYKYMGNIIRPITICSGDILGEN